MGLIENGLGQGNKNRELLAQAIKENKTIALFYLDNDDLGQGDSKNIELLAQAIKENKVISHLGLYDE